MVKFNVKEDLIKGANIICNAVAETFGPQGKNVVVYDDSGIIISKDGSSIGKYCNDSDPTINAAMGILKKISMKTSDDVGDGSTTSLILAQAIINKFKDSSEHPIELARTLNKEVELVLDFLKINTKDVTEDDLIKVATIACNNDFELGKLVSDAFKAVGKNGIVTFEASQDSISSIDVTEGLRLESGYISPYFCNTNKNSCELENALVAIYTDKLTDVKQIINDCEKAMQLNRSILIIAPGIDTIVSRMLILNNENGKLRSCAILSPNHGMYRDNTISDLKLVLGRNMTCDKVIVERDKCTFVGCEQTDKAEYINNIKEVLKFDGLSDFEKEFHKKRIANLSGGIATIKVGGYSQFEITEKMYRVEDSISAVREAWCNGVLPGGGWALYKSAENLDVPNMRDILIEPYERLCRNSNYNPAKSPEFWIGQDFYTKREMIDSFENGILDPFSVVKATLLNSIQAAMLILTLDCIVIN